MKSIEQLMLDDTAASTGVRDSIFYHMLGAERLSASSFCTIAGMTGVEVFVDYLGPYYEPGVMQDTFDVQINIDLGEDRGLWSVQLYGLGIWDYDTTIYQQAKRDGDTTRLVERLKETVLLDFRVSTVTYQPYLKLDRIQPTAERIKAVAMIGQRYNLVDHSYRGIFKELN